MRGKVEEMEGRKIRGEKRVNPSPSLTHPHTHTHTHTHPHPHTHTLIQREGERTFEDKSTTGHTDRNINKIQYHFIQTKKQT